MAEIILENNRAISLGSIDGEKDLKPRPGININPPPQDGRCDCCGRHISELKPFGKAGDPLVGDFDGALLIKMFRPDGPYDEKAEKLYNTWFADCSSYEEHIETEKALKRKYGERKVNRIMIRVEAHAQVGSSWECRDCCILDSEQYFGKLRERGITCDPEDYIAIPQHELRPIESLVEELQKHKKIDYSD
jgi:hypothetical protein